MSAVLGPLATGLAPLVCPPRQREKQAGGTAHRGGDPVVRREHGGQEKVCSTVPGKWLFAWAPQLTASETRSRTFRPRGLGLQFRSWPKSVASNLELSLRGFC